MVLDLLYIFLFGLIIGSFLNVCIYRIPREESVSFPPSHCPVCKENIKWYDNVPVFSYLALKGKCRVCKTKISPEYPIIELLNGVLYLGVYLKFGLSIVLIKWFVFISLLIVLSMIDIKTYEFPEKLTFSLIFFGYIYSFISPDLTLEMSFIGSAVYAFPFMLIYAYGESILHKDIMGFGDVKLAAGIGAFLGYKNFFMSYMFFTGSFVIGALISVILILTKIKERKELIPFGPFLSLSAIVMLLYFN